MEVEELKREVSRLKFQGRVNVQLAFDMITSNDVWMFILPGCVDLLCLVAGKSLCQS